MPFKTSNSPYYKVEITLPGYGQTPRLSTKTERKGLAQKMEQALRYVWEDGHYELIEALGATGIRTDAQGCTRGGRSYAYGTHSMQGDAPACTRVH